MIRQPNIDEKCYLSEFKHDQSWTAMEKMFNSEKNQ